MTFHQDAKEKMKKLAAEPTFEKTLIKNLLLIDYNC